MVNGKNKRTMGGFSLIELVIVVVIIGVIAAIAIPRLSRGSAGAQDSAIAGNLAVLRNAIDLYATEHGGTFPAQADFGDKLTQYTDASGGTKTIKDGTHIYGPYLRKVPPMPEGPKKGATGVDATDGAGIGWLYDEGTGVITANSPNTDASGKPYSAY